MQRRDPHQILQDLSAGLLSPPEAAKALVATDALGGFAMAPGALPPDDRARLDALMPAVRWEMTKLLTGRHAGVQYDSPEYRAIIASAGRNTDEPGGPAV